MHRNNPLQPYGFVSKGRKNIVNTVDDLSIGGSVSVDKISRKEALEIGQTFYFTGGKCLRGHASKRYASTGRCFNCVNQANADPARMAAKRKKQAAYRAANIEKVRDSDRLYREANREAVLASHKAYYEKNKTKKIHSANLRLKRIKRATPAWADLSAILTFYEMSRAKSEATGEVYEVDHIIPLQGRQVCGLHVPENLRVVHRRVNRTKSNRYDLG